MSFTALSPTNYEGRYRFALPEFHNDTWISPFFQTKTLNDSSSKCDYVEITNKDEKGVSAKRLFKKIDIVSPTGDPWECPISMDPWPGSDLDPDGNPLDSTSGILVTSCCDTAFKTHYLIQALTDSTNGKNVCPKCRSDGKGFSSSVVHLPQPPAPAPHHPAPAVFPPALYHQAHDHGTPAGVPSGGKKHKINILATRIIALASCITGFILSRIGLDKLNSSGSSLTHSLASSIFIGTGLTLLGTGITLFNLSNINPYHKLKDKIQDIAAGVLLGSFLNGVGAFVLASAQLTILASSFIGAGAAITTIAAAFFYAKYLC